MEPDYKTLYFALMEKEIDAWERMEKRCSRLTSGNVSHDGCAAQGIAKNTAFLLKRDLKKVQDSTTEKEA